FIGTKLVADRWINIPTYISLLVVLGILSVAVIASLVVPRKKSAAGEKPPEEPEKKSGDRDAAPAGISDLIRKLASSEESTRNSAAREIHRQGQELGGAAIAVWLRDEGVANLIRPQATVGVAVQPAHFERVRIAAGNPHLADVPPDQDAREFEWQVDSAHLDILTTRDPAGSGAIARFLRKFGQGIQQVEFETPDVDRVTAILKSQLGVTPVYPATRRGADGTRVNFFLASAGTKRVLIELVEAPKPEP
ncbi:MAG: hypothetical protein ACRD4K_11555, partial [Candidatus Acidiferrales bacterium]